MTKLTPIHPPPPPPPPPHSAHPPGLLPGIVYSTCFEFLPSVRWKRTNYNKQRFFSKRLIARGYKGDEFRGLFHKAIIRAKTYNGPTTDDDVDHNSVILHLPFHPNDPASFPGTYEKSKNKRKMQRSNGGLLHTNDQ